MPVLTGEPQYQGLPISPPAEDLASATATLGGLSFNTTAVDETQLVFDKITGWYNSTGVRSEDLPRVGGHGSYSTPVQRVGRVIVMSGWLYGPTRAHAEALVARLASLLGDGGTDTFTLTDADAGPMSAEVSLGDEPMVRWDDNPLFAEWQLTLRAVDPRRYGTTTTLSTTLQLPGGGLAPPLTPPLLLPARPAGGSILATNTGKAPAPALFRFTGPQSTPGVVNAARGEWLSYALDLGVSDFLVVDTATGAALLNGVAYRAPKPGSAVTSAFELLPGANDLAATGIAIAGGSPRMSVTFAPAFW